MQIRIETERAWEIAEYFADSPALEDFDNIDTTGRVLRTVWQIVAKNTDEPNTEIEFPERHLEQLDFWGINYEVLE